MAAPKNNRFWELRTSVGRKRLFADPQALWDASTQYFRWCEEHPIMTIDFKGKDATRVEIPKKRAFTMQGLCNFLGIGSLKEYKNNPNYKGFSPIIKQIKDVMYQQKFEGAAAGVFNASIIARDLKLVEHQEVKTQKIKRKEPDFSKVPTDELRKLVKKYSR